MQRLRFLHVSLGMRVFTDPELEQRLRPTGKAQSGNAIEPRQRLLRIAPMKRDDLVFSRHDCLYPRDPCPVGSPITTALMFARTVPALSARNH